MDIDTFKINNLQDNIIVYDNNEKTQVAEIGTVTDIILEDTKFIKQLIIQRHTN